jgi:hypothetical protein
MKTILTSLLLTLSIAATAQTQTHSSHSRTHSSITDDDKTLSIQIEGTVNGKDVRYDRTFSILGMSKVQKEALKSRVLDSLGMGEPPTAPKPPMPPTAPASPGFSSSHSDDETVTFVCPTCTGRMRLEVSGENFSLTRETDAKKDKANPFPMTATMRPGKYQYTYWQNGVRQIDLPFVVKVGEATVVTIK